MPSQTLDVIEDAHERGDGTLFNDTNSVVRMDDAASSASRFNGGFYFELSSAIPAGSTITDAYLTLEMDGTENPDGKLHAQDSGGANDFSTTANIYTRTPTANSTTWTTTGLTGSVNSPSFTSAIQELIDTYGTLAIGTGICILFITNQNGTSTFRVDSVDSGGTPADLYLEWTPPATGHAGTAVSPPSRLKSKLQGLVS